MEGELIYQSSCVKFRFRSSYRIKVTPNVCIAQVVKVYSLICKCVYYTVIAATKKNPKKTDLLMVPCRSSCVTVTTVGSIKFSIFYFILFCVVSTSAHQKSLAKTNRQRDWMSLYQFTEAEGGITYIFPFNTFNLLLKRITF